MKKNIKKIVSYVYPFVVEARKGEVTPYLEVAKSRGKYVLNTHNVNYSYDGLHKIMDQLFKHIKLQNYSFNNILILGMGAGSIISILRDKYKINSPITAIEKDKTVIDLAAKYFNIKRFEHLKIVHQDAFDFVKTNNEKFDLIISDIFINDNVPTKFASKEYLMNLRKIASSSCIVAYNKMTQEQYHKEELVELLFDFNEVFPKCELLKFYAYESENSILYSNTIPVPKKKTEKASYLESQSVQMAVAFS